MSLSSFSSISSQAANKVASVGTSTTVMLDTFTAAPPTTDQIPISSSFYWQYLMFTFSGTYDFVYIRFSTTTFVVFQGKDSQSGSAQFPYNSTGIQAWAYAGTGKVPTTYITGSSGGTILSAPIILTDLKVHQNDEGCTVS